MKNAQRLSCLLALLSALACVLDADCTALRGTHRASAGRLRLRGGAEERCAEPPCDRPEGPEHQLPACCQRAVAAAQQRAERAERRAAGLQRRLDELEEEFCAAESGRMQARAEVARATEEAERKVRAELEGRLAVLNQRCNEAEAEVQWGNGERTRDLLVMAELKHKIEEHERERADIEEKIRRELAADGRCAAQNAGSTAPEVPLDLWDAADGNGEPSSHGPACWCGAQGGEGGDVAGDGGWTGLEASDAGEGPAELVHAIGCARSSQPACDDGNDAAVPADYADGLTPLQLYDKMRLDARFADGMPRRSAESHIKRAG